MHAAHGRSSLTSRAIQRFGYMLLAAAAIAGLLLIVVLFGDQVG